jgi:hypothetical protein
LFTRYFQAAFGSGLTTACSTAKMPDPTPLRRRRKRQREPMRLAAAEHAVRIDERRRGPSRHQARPRQPRRLPAHQGGSGGTSRRRSRPIVGAAMGELAPLVLRAMGRNVSFEEIKGARRALEILLEALPDY